MSFARLATGGYRRGMVHECRRCSFLGDSKMFKRHAISHMAFNDAPFQCNVCHRAFGVGRELRRHCEKDHQYQERLRDAPSHQAEPHLGARVEEGWVQPHVLQLECQGQPAALAGREDGKSSWPPGLLSQAFAGGQRQVRRRRKALPEATGPPSRTSSFVWGPPSSSRITRKEHIELCGGPT